MRAELLDPADLSPEQLAAWSSLASAAVEPNPFFEPGFVLPSIAGLGATDVRLLVASEQDGRWRGCVPVRRERRWRRVPLGSLASWLHPYCFLGTPLIDRDRIDEAAAAMLSAARERGSAALLGLSLLAEGPVLSAIERAAAELGSPALRYESFDRAALRRRADGDYLALNRKHEREIARTRRRLGELLGEELRTVQRAGDPAAVEDFLRIEASGWKGREGTAFASIPGHADLLREVCRGFAERGRLWILGLQTSQRTVAMNCNLISGDEIYCFKIAFDEEYARFSPGLQLQVENVDYFRQSDSLELMDSCALPDNQMINRLWAGRRTIAATAVPLAGLRGRLAPAAVRTARRLAVRSGS